MSRPRLIAPLLSIALAVTGCTQASRVPTTSSYNADVITLAEAGSVNAGSAYDLIKKTRPNFLSYRGPATLIGTSPSMPTVYVDGMKYGTIESLRQIPVAWVAEVRMYRVSAASPFGSENTGGVLAITTHRR